MTAHRRPSIPFSDAPRGTCRWCGEYILYERGDKQGEIDRRRRWHPDCVDVYNASDPREARRVLRKRDRGVCAECGLDTHQLRRELPRKGRAARLRELGFKPRRSLWELDHVVPLIDGGGHELENLQTLCVPCHEAKTRREASERAERRREPERDTPPVLGAPVERIPDSGPASFDVPPVRDGTSAEEVPAPTSRPATARQVASDPPATLERLLQRADEINERAAHALRDWRES